MNNNYKSIIFFILLLLMSFSTVHSIELTLSDALKSACEKSSRAEIINGDLEVAEQYYNAEKINFYLPEISLNGNLPIYNVMESFGNIYGQSQKSLNKRTTLNYNANIDLRQSLITGGELLIKSQLVNNKSDLPQTNNLGVLEDVTQRTKQGVFDFSFTQPLLKPSEPKNNLRDKKDDLEIARLTQAEEITTLKDEVIEAYFGVILAQLEYTISNRKAESAKEKAGIDSIKYKDGIFSEEAWLESASANLDAELNQFDAENNRIEKNRDLTMVLDIDVDEEIKTSTPALTGKISENQKKAAINSWAISVPVVKAQYNFSKIDRQAEFAAASHGLTGTFNANYTIGRGEFKSQDFKEDNNTDSWGMSVNFSLPLWDGGSAGAAVKAARLNSKKSELELERIKKSERAIIVNLVNKIDISYQKISVLNKQIELAKNKLSIAEFRHDDGQISILEILDSKVYYLEAQKKYMEELKDYFKNINKLEGKYVS